MEKRLHNTRVFLALYCLAGLCTLFYVIEEVSNSTKELTLKDELQLASLVVFTTLITMASVTAIFKTYAIDNKLDKNP